MGQRTIRRALVIGGGIAGPVLSMFLRQVGVEVLLAERRTGSARAEGAFLGVAPNGMNVLQALGVAEKVAALGAPCTAFRFLNAQGRPIGGFDRSRDAERFGAALTMVRRGELQDLLLEQAVKRGVQVRLGARLVRVDTSRPDTVVTHFEDGTQEEGDVLVGCDGLRSTTRALLLPEAPEPHFSGLWDYGGFARGVSVPARPGVNEMLFGRRAFFGLFVTPQGEAWWFHNGPAGERREGGEAARERLLELHRDDPPWVADVLRATPEVLGPWPLSELRDVPRWSEGRVCLLGDAAHAMSPSAGQGASLAMEDAMVLAMCLRDGGDAPARALQTYERLRRPRVSAIAAVARRHSNNKAPESAAALWLRDRLMPLFLKLGQSAQDRGYAHRIDWTATAR